MLTFLRHLLVYKKGDEILRKLDEGETFVAAIFVPLVLVLLLVYAIVVHGWLGGAAIGKTEISDLALQIGCELVIIFLPMYLILKYAGEKNISADIAYL